MKVSKPILLLLGVLAVAAAWTMTEPDDAPKKPSHHTTKTTKDKKGDFTSEDYSAHFARYVPHNRNAFQPGIVPSHAAAAAAAKSGPAGKLGAAGTWALTGISTLNDAPSALVENTAERASVFLSVGEKWNGLRVVAIRPDAVDFVDAKGKHSTLGFQVDIATPGARGVPGAPARSPATANAGARSR
jgi:hypothetical protein